MRGKLNLLAYCSWYVHHEALFHDEFESHFLQPLIPDLYLGFVLEMYMAPPFGDELRMEIVTSQHVDSNGSIALVLRGPVKVADRVGAMVFILWALLAVMLPPAVAAPKRFVSNDHLARLLNERRDHEA